MLRDITVATVHRFQGDERDVMVFSPVIASGMTEGAARWEETPRNLINVAVTRAREALVVVADFDACRALPGILDKPTRYVEDVGMLRQTSAAQLELSRNAIAFG